MTQLWAILLVLGACVLGSFAPILMKKGTARIHMEDGLVRMLLRLLTNWRLIAGLGLYGLSSVLFIPALRGGDLSILYPLVAVGYVFVAIWSVLILKERMTALKWVSIGLILVGVTIVGLA